MNNYDSMTVDELISEYAEWARNRVGTHWEIRGTQGVVVDDENPLNVVARKHTIIAAVRERVVREASVGVGTVEVPEDTEVYVKMVKAMAYWKGRYEMAVRGMTDKAAIEIMGYEP